MSVNSQFPISVLVLEETILGKITLTASPIGLLKVSIRNHTPIDRDRYIEMQTQPKWLFDLKEQLSAYFHGERTKFDAPIDWHFCTPFQKKVLQAVQETEYGQIKSYGDIARKIDIPRGSQAVGQAIGKNPVPIVIPCHRIIGSQGHLTGFSAEGGLNTKTQLLQLEGHRIVDQKLV